MADAGCLLSGSFLTEMNILTYRETLSSVDLSYECTNTLKTLGKAGQCGNVLMYKETLRRVHL